MTASEVPLARLMAIAYRQLIGDLHRRLEERNWHDTRPAYGFVLLATRDRPVTVSELCVDLGMTKQAASKLVDALVRLGYLDRTDRDGGARTRPVVLSARGRDLLAEVEEIYAELERGWAERIGAEGLDRLRRDLITAVAEPDGSLPPIRPLW